MDYLFHLFCSDDFAPVLEPESLVSEGFVHLSNANQLVPTAERWYSESSNLKVMVLSQEPLLPSLKWEDLYGRGERFPHLYSSIPIESIQAVVSLKRDSRNRFAWPDCLNGLQSPLLEALTEETALIEPSRRFPEKKLPEQCLLCFFSEVLEGLVQRPGVERFHGLGSEIGATDVYTVPIGNGQSIAVCHPGVGGPLAAATLEELIALGCRDFFLCGGAGSLVPRREVGRLILVEGAWRDEGTSHHYSPPSPTLSLSQAMLESARQTLIRGSVAFEEGTTWTTDALYRETPTRIARRRESGCLTVEMEIASLAAVAQYRGAQLGALLYCGDDVSSETWDFRDWTAATTVRERLFELGLEVLGNRQKETTL